MSIKTVNFILYKNGQEIRLSSEKERGQFLTLSTLKTHGVDFIRYDLGITDYVTILKEVRKKLQESKNRIDEINTESISMQDLPQVVTDVEQDFKEAVSILLSHGYTAREMLGLDKALQTNRGELVNNLAKSNELNEEIKDLEKLIIDAQGITRYNGSQYIGGD